MFIPNKLSGLVEKFFLKIFFSILLVSLMSLTEAQCLYSQQTQNKSSVIQNKVLIDSLYYYKIIDEKDSVLSSKRIFKYDEYGNVTCKLSLIFDADLKIWINRDKEEYTYDIHGNNTLYVVSSWSKNESRWNGIQKMECNYNGLNQPIIFKESMSPLMDGIFTPYDSVFSYFSILGKDSISTLFVWYANNDKWKVRSKSQYNYDKNNNQIKLVGSLWDENIKEWMEVSKKETFYDSSNRDTLILSSNYNTTKNQWIPNYQYENYFDDFSTTQILYVWDTSLMKLIYSGKKVSIFDDDGNVRIFKSYKISDTTNDWVENYREENIFDNGIQKYQYIYDWDYQLNKLTHVGSFIFFSHLNNVVSNQTTTHLARPIIYPNPVIDKIFINTTCGINISKMRIFNSSGKLLSVNTINEGENFCDMSLLTRGYYFIQLITSNNTLYYKILKE